MQTSRPLRRAALALPLILASCGAGETRAGGTEVLAFTAIPDDNATLLRERFQPLAEHLSRELGLDFTYVPTASYQASVEAFKNGDVQLAWFGGLTGAQARAAVPGARAIAQGVIDPRFRSYFIAHSGTGVERSDEFPSALAGKSFTFGSDSSTSGRLMPEYFIRKHTGASPEEFFGAPNHFSGSHDRTARLVEAGTFQAGAINYRTYDRMVAEGKLDPEVCRIVWVTPEYSDYNWTVHPDLDARLIENLRDALTSLRDPELLRAVDRAEGLMPATNADFQPLADLASELGFLSD